MESCILLHNNFYKSSEILMDGTLKLLEKLHISVVRTESIALDDKFLPFISPVVYFSSLIKLLEGAYKEGQKVFVCDSKSLSVIRMLLKKLYKDIGFREEISKKCECNIDILNLEDSFVFAPEVFLDKIGTTEIKRKRWEGFRCAFIIDRELEGRVKELRLLPNIESVTGLKIFPFFKDDYAYLLQSNPELSFKMGAMDYYEMVDCGVDFIMSANIGNFELMDKNTRKLQDISGRDIAEIPLLFIPQVILALFMDTNAKSLSFNAHKIQPQML